MKKVWAVCLLFVAFLGGSIAVAEVPSAQVQAEEIYSRCEKQIPKVDEMQVLQGNVADVARERELRQCLKGEIVKIAGSFLASEEMDYFKQQLDNMETTTAGIYRVLIFCQEDGDKAWCKQFYKDDASLGKLLLEKNVTSQMMNVLSGVIDAKQGGLAF